MDEAQIRVWELLRARIVHEEVQARRRVSWLLATSGLLVVAYALLVTVSTDVSIRQTLLRGYLLLLVPVVGFLLALLVWIGLAGAALAVRAALAEWERLSSPEGGRRQLPALYPTGWALWLERAASWGICALLAVTWVLFFVLTVNLI